MAPVGRGVVGHLSHGRLVLLHQLVHVLLILLQPALDLILLTLKAAQLLLQLDGGKTNQRASGLECLMAPGGKSQLPHAASNGRGVTMRPDQPGEQGPDPEALREYRKGCLHSTGGPWAK